MGLPALTKMTQKVEGAAHDVSDVMTGIRRGPLGSLTDVQGKGYKVE